jgi:hypothetical protein
MRSKVFGIIVICLFFVSGCVPEEGNETNFNNQTRIEGAGGELNNGNADSLKRHTLDDDSDLNWPGKSATSSNEMVSISKARQVVEETYPDLNFDTGVMSGLEKVDDEWVEGYMLSARDGSDIIQVIVDGRTGEVVKEVALEDYAVRSSSSCYVSSMVFGAWYSQNDPSWSSDLLGNSSTDTMGDYGCVITSLAMAYHNVWNVSTTPDQLNNSATSAGCFGPGSSLVNVSCAINSRGGPHSVSTISMSSVATEICNGNPVMVDVTWGGGHKMMVYHYTGGSTTSMSSYDVVDPWDGTSKSLSSYSATRWRALY